MKYSQIFVTEKTRYRNRSEYEFVAEFANPEDAGKFMREMRDRKEYSGKDIIIVESDSAVINNENGEVKCVCAVTGEYLPLDEFWPDRK